MEEPRYGGQPSRRTSTLIGLAPWQAPGAPSLGRLNGAPIPVPHADAESARAGDDASIWKLSLDGSDWRFRLLDSPAELTPDLLAHVTPDDDWERLTVPGTWTRQGHDSPHYTNVIWPFDAEPPQLPDDNPVGLHHTTFDLPTGWDGREIILRVGSAESCLIVWCNGEPVGWSKDSRVGAEFNLTPHLVRGEQTLCLACVRWSDGSWLEQQDDWWLAGLQRSVELLAVGPVHLGDLAANGSLGPDGEGALSVEIRVEGLRSDETGWLVRTRLERLDGAGMALVGPDGSLRRRPLDHEVPVFRHGDHLTQMVSANEFRGSVVRADIPVPDARPWSPAEPHLHRLMVSLVSPTGETIQVSQRRVGFRTVEIAGRELRINGRPERIHGVNWKAHSAQWGRTVTVDEMRADVVAMKRHNINALRCSHEPPDPRMLDLCDEYGLYVIDEANLETHGRAESLLLDPAFLTPALERVTRMVLRDRSHPSVIIWSLGNEAGDAPVHDAAAAWIRRVDPTRPLQYEGEDAPDWAPHIPDRPGPRRPTPLSDLSCPMYPGISQLVAWSHGPDQRPLLMCEYSHAMGNSNGGLSDYWDAIDSHPGLIGGFIWDWIDQGLALDIADELGEPVYGHGEHVRLEGVPHDADFCINGLVGSDRRPHPAMAEVAKVGEPITVSGRALTKGGIRIRNRHSRPAADWLTCRWRLLVDGEQRQTGTLDLTGLGADSEAPFDVPISRPDGLVRGQECHLELSFRTAKTAPWAERGFEVAWAQLVVPWTRRRASLPAPTGGDALPPEVDRSVDGLVSVRTTNGWTMVLDEHSGSIVSFSGPDGPLLSSDPRLCLWRAPTQNDGSMTGPLAGVRDPLGAWLRWGLDRLVCEPTRASIRRSASGVRVVADRAIVVDGERRGSHRRRLTILGDATVVVDEQVRVPTEWNDLPRLGVRLSLHGIDDLEWLGLGPHETYPDRWASGRFGRWTSTPTAQDHPYLVPQEQGHHHDTRWLRMTGEAGAVGFAASGPMGFSASHLDLEDMTRAHLRSDLTRKEHVMLHLDHLMRGVGTAACGPDIPASARIPGGSHRWTWWIAPGDEASV